MATVPSHFSGSSTPSSSYFDQVEDLDPLMVAASLAELEETLASQQLPQSSYAPSLRKRKLYDSSTSVPAAPHSKHPKLNDKSLFDGSSSSNNVLDTSSHVPTSADGILAPYIIAQLPNLFEEVRRLPYGCQWELARLGSADGPQETFTRLDIAHLQSLKTNTLAGPEVGKIIARKRLIRAYENKEMFADAFAKERAAKRPWTELDKEERILTCDPYGGLGCNQDKPYLKDDPDWYGGRVQFMAELHVEGLAKSRKPVFRISLKRPELGPSNRFARRFGSRRFIRIRIPEHTQDAMKRHGHDDEEIITFFARPFIIHDKVFRAFFAKEQNVFVFQTSERWNGRYIVERGQSRKGSEEVPQELDLHELLMWHNPASANQDQSMVKWAARFALGLSTSVPGIRLQASQIHEDDDIICAAHDGKGKVPNEMIMTDGCGLVARGILRHIHHQLHWTCDTTALQMRLSGAKGLLITDPRSIHSEDITQVHLRRSQIKIRPLSNDVTDPAMLTIDILRPGCLSSPAHLSAETIINLAENGVPHGILSNLMTLTMRNTVDQLSTWNGPSGVYELWRNVARDIGLVSFRLTRESVGSARAQGYASMDLSYSVDVDLEIHEDGFAGVDNAVKENSAAWWIDPISGCPASLGETILTLLESGFTPDKCAILAFKMRKHTQAALKKVAENYRIEIPMSCKAFVVPDPCNVLEPGEVYISSSSRNLLGRDGDMTNLVLGEVLLTRHPCKVPTDVQKAKAVFHECLRSYTDVVIVSTKDHLFDNRLLHRHLASMTGGGDYDGDVMEVFWDPSIVSDFTNASPAFAEEPEAVRRSLTKITETVPDFLKRTSTLPSRQDVLYEYQKYLLGALRNVSMVGIYSTWWEASSYKNGYAHEKTIFLAHMFTSILDGSKTGVTVSRDVYRSHSKMYDSDAVPWRKKKTFDTKRLRRNPSLDPFIMSRLEEKVDVERGILEKLIDERLLEGKPAILDLDLARPWEDANIHAAEAEKEHGNTWMRQELELIRLHVEDLYEEHRAAIAGMNNHAVTGKGKGKLGRSESSMTQLPIQTRQDILRKLSQRFHMGPTVSTDGGEKPAHLVYFHDAHLLRVRASYAYVHDHRRGGYRSWSAFPWDVALRTLCEIKATALGQTKTMTGDFHTRMVISNSFIPKS